MVDRDVYSISVARLVVSLIPRGEVSTILVSPLTLGPGDDGASEASFTESTSHRRSYRSDIRARLRDDKLLRLIHVLQKH